MVATVFFVFIVKTIEDFIIITIPGPPKIGRPKQFVVGLVGVSSMTFKLVG
ncbi:hypothetical protein O9993_16190 [Vibrio lentus]|nr:hypothetical protein [Vibrio lentus]